MVEEVKTPEAIEASTQPSTHVQAEEVKKEESEVPKESEAATSAEKTEEPKPEQEENTTPVAKDTTDSINTEKELESGSISRDEKKLATSHVQNVKSDEDEEPEVEKIHWIPGVRAQFPWVGLIGILCVFLAMGLASAILATSDGERVTQWPTRKHPIAPNVLLNLVNQLSSLGLLTAITQGMAIAWWRRALRGGTLEELYRSHTFSNSLMAVLTSGKYFNTIALAALMTKFAIIDSTLFQEATKTTSMYMMNYQQSPVKVWIGTEWPAGVGGIPGTDGETRALSSNFTNIIQAFNTMIGNGKIHDNAVLFTGCPQGQTCTGTLDALGFDYNCSLSLTDIDYGAWRLQNLSAPPNTSETYPLWNIDFSTVWATPERPWASIMLDMIHVNSTEGPERSCPGTLAHRKCEITPAVVHYPATVLASTPQASMNVTHIAFSNSTAISYPYNTDLNAQQIDTLVVKNRTHLYETADNISTVGAITFTLNNLFKSSAYLAWSHDWDLDVQGSRAQIEFPANSTDFIADHCAYAMDTMTDHTDPFIDLLREMNNFAFISAMYLAGAPFTAQNDRDAAGFPSTNFTTEVKGYVQMYRTNYNYVAGALVATLITIVCVLPVYWGFWTLGRKVSLDPFEIANAFSAPIFSGVKKQNGEVDQLIGEMGDRRVKYGVLVDSGDKRLGLADPEKVAKPQKAGTSAGAFTKRAGVGAVVSGAVAALVTAKAEGLKGL